MTHGILRLTLAFIIVGLLAACGPTAATAIPTDTSVPPTSTPVPTDTLTPTATLRPTRTPRPTATTRPTNTPQPTASAPAGFKPIMGGKVTLWLPESFEGGSMTGKDREVILKNLRGLGGEYANLAKQFEAMADNVLFLAFNSEPNEQGGATTVNIVEIPALSRMKPLTLATTMAEQLPQQIKGITVGEVEAVDLPNYPAARFTAQMSVNNFSIKEVAYVIKAGDVTYLVTFAALEKEFEEWLPIFEQSIQTFTVEP
jgi:hypothetical protein